MPTRVDPTRPDPDRRRRSARPRHERGAASVLALSLVAVAGALVVAIGVSSPALIDQARADAVSDVAALAAVAGGPEAARSVAARSGAEQVVVRPSPDGRDGAMVVRVVLEGRTAVATAAPEGAPWPEEPVGGP